MEKYFGIAIVIILILAGMVAYLSFVDRTPPETASKTELETRPIQPGESKNDITEPDKIEKSGDKTEPDTNQEDSAKKEKREEEAFIANAIEKLKPHLSSEEIEELQSLLRKNKVYIKAFLESALNKLDEQTIVRIKEMINPGSTTKKTPDKTTGPDKDYESDGDEAMAKGELDRAIESFIEAKAVKPNDDLFKKLVRALNIRGTKLRDNGKLEAALKDFEMAANISSSEELLTEIGDTYMLLKKYNQAKTSYQKAIEQNEKYVPAHAGLAEAFLASNQLTKALEHCNAAIVLDGKYPKAFFVRGMVKARLCKEKESAAARDNKVRRELNKLRKDALKDFTEVTRLNPSNKIKELNYLERGKLLLSMMNFVFAAKDFERSLDQNENNTETLLKLAFTKLAMKKVAEARWHIDNVIKLDPNNAEAYNKRALTQENKNSAMADFNKAIELDPDNSDFYQNRGNLYAHMGNLDKALEDISKSISLKDDNPAAYMTRAAIYAKQKPPQLDKALLDATRAIELNPNNPETYTIRALIHRDKYEIAKDPKDLENFKKDKQKAMEIGAEYSLEKKYQDMVAEYLGLDPWTPYYKKPAEDTTWLQTINHYEEQRLKEVTPELDTKLRDAYFNQATEFVKEFKFRPALENLDQTLRLDSKYANGYVAHGAINYILGDLPSAEEDFSNALKYDPNNANAYYLRGKTLEALGKPLDAERDFAQAKKLKVKLIDPDS